MIGGEKMYYAIVRTDDYISHHGVKGQKWGRRRYQNVDGTLINPKGRPMSQKQIAKVQRKKLYKTDAGAELRFKKNIRNVGAIGLRLSSLGNIAAAALSANKKQYAMAGAHVAASILKNFGAHKLRQSSKRYMRQIETKRKKVKL